MDVNYEEQKRRDNDEWGEKNEDETTKRTKKELYTSIKHVIRSRSKLFIIRLVTSWVHVSTPWTNEIQIWQNQNPSTLLRRHIYLLCSRIECFCHRHIQSSCKQVVMVYWQRVAGIFRLHKARTVYYRLSFILFTLILCCPVSQFTLDKINSPNYSRKNNCRYCTWHFRIATLL